MPRAIGSTIKSRPNVTVVPIQFDSQEPQLTSPRNHSKTKLKLVSPSIKHHPPQLKENYPPTSPRNDSVNKRTSAQIELGGKGLQTSMHRRNRKSGDLYQSGMTNTRDIRSRSKEWVDQNAGPVRYSSYLGNALGQNSRAASPQRYSIHYASIPASYHSPAEVQKVQNVAMPDPAPVVAQPKWSESQYPKGRMKSNYNLPSELAIKQENTMQNLKQSYESEMKEIKRLQEEISSNNQEIKQLLKQSSASKRSSNSNKDLSEKIEKESNLAESREPSIWDREQRRQPFENAITSKKTLINDLKIQTSNRLQKQSSLGQRSNGEVSVQTDHCLPADPDSPTEIEPIVPKFQRLSLTKNEECQVLIIAHSGRDHKQQQQSLKGSIIHDSRNSIEAQENENIAHVDKISNISESRRSQRSQLGKYKRSAVKVSPLKISHHSQQRIQGSFHKKSQTYVGIEKVPSETQLVKEDENLQLKVDNVENVQQIQSVQDNPIPVSQKLLSQIPSNKDVSIVSASRVSSKKTIHQQSQPIPTPAVSARHEEQNKPPEGVKQLRKISNRIYL